MMRMRSLLILLAFLVAPLIFNACSDDDGDGPADATMVLVPAGNYQMGDDNANYEPNERPARTVAINAFFISKTEVTQALYQSVIGANPSHNKGDRRPVENVTWFEALEFCNALSRRDGYTEVYSDITGNLQADFSADGYRLPTEAEWEFACRGGTTTPYYTGSSKADLEKAGWYSGNANGTTHDVSDLEANTHGIHDMHGNVFEWCWDWFSAAYYQQGENNNPRGPSGGEERVCRGGSYFVFEYGCRSSFRSMLTPQYKSRDIGIRLARTAN